MIGAVPTQRRRGRLLRKYLVPLVVLVAGALVTSGGLDMWFSYRENRAALAQIQSERAVAAAADVERFIDDIIRQIGWTTRSQWSPALIEQRRFEYGQLLRQAPAITEVIHLDAEGREELKVSRVDMDAFAAGTDFSASPRFREARARKIWFSPVYFHKDSEPYMTIAVAGQVRDRGVTVAEVNLKFILEVITRIKVGKAGYTYVVDSRGLLIGHPDIGLVLRKTDLSGLMQVAAAVGNAGTAREVGMVGRDPAGNDVLTASAPIESLGWRVFVELPLSEALAPLYAAALRTGGLMLLGLGFAVPAGFFLARRIVEPVRRLQAGAARLGAGDLAHRIEVRTNDELEALADDFNAMAGQLRESYASLERKVEERTHELTESLEYQTATAEVLGAISRTPSNLEPVLRAILATASRLCGADISHIARPDEHGEWRTVVSHGYAPEQAEQLSKLKIPLDRSSLTGRVNLERRTVQIVDVLNDPEYDIRWSERLGHYRTHLGVPLLCEGRIVGMLGMSRINVAPFDPKHVKLLETFADQAVIAVENARLVQELKSQSQALADSVEELKSLGAAGQAVVATLNLGKVLETLAPRAVEIAKADAGIVFRYVRDVGEFQVWRSAGLQVDTLAEISSLRILQSETTMGRAVNERRTIHIKDMQAAPQFPLRDVAARAGYHSVLIVPLARGARVFGALTLLYHAVDAIPERTADLMQTFAGQCILAIQNARLFREIEEKGRQLELASQHKSQFLANMSHELRTPLNAILGYTELLADGIYGELSQRQQEVLERVQSNGRHLLGLINDVLDLAKIEAGQLNLVVEEYALPEVVRQVVAATEPLAAAKGLTLSADVVNGMPLGLGDERRLKQVLLNLVGNAIKFTDAGTVQIRAVHAEDSFALEVIDTGPGIEPEDQARIFDEFQQIDNTSTRHKGGTGLGLAISRRIVEMHGGLLSVESEPGRGSTFRVVLPIRGAEQVAA